jgi:hypothetical protein
MRQLTIRGFDSDLARALKRLARELGVSLNQAAIQLMKRGVRVGRGTSEEAAIGQALDDFIGADPEAARDIERAEKDFEHVDEALWR